MVQNKRYISALDIGTSQVRAVIGEVINDEIHIIGVGEADSQGLKAGMVTNIDVTAQAIHQAMSEAEHMADCKICSVTTGISGNHIRSFNSLGIVKIKDGEVSAADIERAKESAKTTNIPPDYQILHTVIQEHIIDNQPGVRQPIGMSGIRLDTRVHIITGAVTAIQNIKKCIERCHLNVDETVLLPLASAAAVLTEDEKELGVCVIDIGSGTTDIAVYTNGAIRHTAVIPIAGDLITRDLTHALRTPYHAAEHIKKYYGTAIEGLDNSDEMVEVPSVGERQPRQVARHVLASVIGPRVEEILELVLNELRRAGYPEDILTSGVVLTGGTAQLRGVAELAEEIFNLPVRVGMPKEMGGLSEYIHSTRYAAVAGLLLFAKQYMDKNGTNSGVANRRLPEQETSEAVAHYEQGLERRGGLFDLSDDEPKESMLNRFKAWVKRNF